MNMKLSKQLLNVEVEIAIYGGIAEEYPDTINLFTSGHTK